MTKQASSTEFLTVPSYGFRRMRWRGIAKARLQTHFTAIAYNLKRTLNILSPA